MINADYIDYKQEFNIDLKNSFKIYKKAFGNYYSKKWKMASVYFEQIMTIEPENIFNTIRLLNCYEKCNDIKKYKEMKKTLKNSGYNNRVINSFLKSLKDIS